MTDLASFILGALFVGLILAGRFMAQEFARYEWRERMKEQGWD